MRTHILGNGKAYEDKESAYLADFKKWEDKIEEHEDLKEDEIFM